MRQSRFFVYAIVALVVMGCSLNLPQADVELPTEYIYSNGFNLSDSPISDRWWESFDDAHLNELVEVALYQNRDLAATATTVAAARHYIRVAESEFLPSLSFDAEVELTHEEGATTKEYTVAPTLTWELSLFGALRNTKRSAVAALFAKEWNYRAAILSLTSQVATSYFTLLEYQRCLYIATRSYELRRTATALVDSMYRYGMSSGTDLMQAKSLVYSAKAEMDKFKRATMLTSLSLGELLGEVPSLASIDARGVELINDDMPISVPVGLPSSLLERRPDVMESYYSMEEAASQVGVSRAGRFPMFTITGSGGIFSTSLKGLTSGDPLLWSATTSLTAPIFSFGALKRKELIEREKYMESLLNYEQAIIEALSDVESALATISTYSDQSASSAALVLANSKIVQNTSALYRSGLGDYLSVIDAERELYSSQIDLIEIVAQQYINYVALFKALGGGW